MTEATKTCPICSQPLGHVDSDWCDAEIRMITDAEDGDDDE